MAVGVNVFKLVSVTVLVTVFIAVAAFKTVVVVVVGMIKVRVLTTGGAGGLCAIPENQRQKVRAS